ncbi:MAG TPA: ribonuclease H-like domain-containing protein [Candidatus Methylomirabilis sp.]|nr:ribonuclease H-like domain-containing protein [Candidatus Methylomirabilis sp.]
MSGFDAVLLWHRYLRGDRQALDLLVEYNRADVDHPQTIMGRCYDRLAMRMRTLFCALRPSADVPPLASEALAPLSTVGRGSA